MLEPVKSDYRATVKIILRSVLKIVAPLAVLVLIIFMFLVVQSHRKHREQAAIREAVLYDFDYLLTALEQNLPTIDIIYRRHGVDMLALGQEFRAELEERESDVYYLGFWRDLRRDFLWRAGGISHLDALTEGMRQWLLSYYTWGSGPPTFGRYVEILSVPPVFYADMHVGLPNAHIEQNITFDIVERGYIAYVRVRHFAGHLGREMVQTRRFLSEVHDYRHLIIDLRSNTGGAPRYFHDLIGYWIIREPHTMYINNFYMAGRQNIEFMNSMGTMRPQSTSFTLEDAMGFVTDEYIHILEDIMRMDYHYVYRHMFSPPPMLSIPFSGKIWMLVDENMFSAAQLVSSFYKETGYVTLVGDTTGGGLAFCNMSIFSNYLTLPNTGIIVRYDAILSLDSRGRPIEYGTEPHYFNRPGMDALETVLALIEEGWYR